jgi:hypothetical protein
MKLWQGECLSHSPNFLLKGEIMITINVMTKGRYVREYRKSPTLRTHCKRGHERVAENMTKSLACRVCANASRRSHYDPEKRAQRHQAARAGETRSKPVGGL